MSKHVHLILKWDAGDYSDMEQEGQEIPTDPKWYAETFYQSDALIHDMEIIGVEIEGKPAEPAPAEKLYRFGWHCGRMGTVEGVFVATDAEVQAAMGERVSFGEILGKHSNIHGVLEADDLEVLSDAPEVISLMKRLFGSERTVFGYNPLHYLEAA